ncbi:hypothetical protein BSKO_10997 [Bryopsis sp. KO-2023]|nr:hypothetical protein BSKO_10997 [Bryopsis sp. KO-2023]
MAASISKLRLVLGGGAIVHIFVIWIWLNRYYTSHQTVNGVPDLDLGVYEEEPLDVLHGIDGNVREVEWDASKASEICSLISPYTEKNAAAEPLLIRNAVNWDILKEWNLSFIADQDIPVDAWAAPGMKFYYAHEAKLKKLMNEVDVKTLPVTTTKMSSKEAVLRMQKDSPFPNMFYEDSEHYYFRFDLTPEMRRRLDLDSGVFRCMDKSRVHEADVFMNPPRVWVSPKGAVSPLHYDRLTSLFIQVYGVKRMVLYNRGDIKSIYPYPANHLLARRGQVDPVDPDYSKFPAFKNVHGKLAIINPGDLLLFQKDDPHYTDTLSTSISLTWRWI